MKNQFKRFFKRDRALNLIYRGLTILCKFLLSILIVNKLSVEDLGVYGIFQTTITLLVYLLGFDFYTYNMRELIKNEKESIDFYIGNQIVFHALIYLVCLPFTFFLFLWNVIDLQYFVYFYLILISEHISQEIYRILIALKKSVAASFTLFLRGGIWIVALYILWTFEWAIGTIKLVFLLWTIGAFVSLWVGFSYLRFKLRFKVDFQWLLKGIRVATPFLMATIFYKIIEFSGRYFIDFYWTKEDVGLFTFFSGISNAVFIFVQTTVIIVMSPLLIESSNKGPGEFLGVFKNYKKQLLTTTIIGLVLASFCIYPILLYLQKDILMQNILVFVVLMLACTLFCFSYIPHYGLYAYHRDGELLKASLFGAVIIVLLNFIFVPKFGALGAAWAQAISMLSLLVLKWQLYNKLQNE